MRDYRQFIEGYKTPNFKKIDKQIERHREGSIRKGPDPQELSGKYRDSSRNRAFKMSGVRDSLLRGEDPRQDTRGGAYKKKGNPDKDHRAGYGKNPLNSPPRRVKNPGAGEKGDQVGGRKRGINRVHGTTRLIPDSKGGYKGLSKPLGKKKDVNESFNKKNVRDWPSIKNKKEPKKTNVKYDPHMNLMAPTIKKVDEAYKPISMERLKKREERVKHKARRSERRAASGERALERINKIDKKRRSGVGGFLRKNFGTGMSSARVTRAQGRAYAKMTDQPVDNKNMELLKKSQRILNKKTDAQRKESGEKKQRWNQNRPKSDAPKTLRFKTRYHGTSKTGAKGIKEKGFKDRRHTSPEKRGSHYGGNRIYTTTNKQYADSYAGARASQNQERGRGVTLKLKTSQKADVSRPSRSMPASIPNEQTVGVKSANRALKTYDQMKKRRRNMIKKKN